MKRIFAGLVAASLLAGCASSGKHAPVVVRGKVAKSTEKDWRPRVHVVQKGDTLYAIAFNYGLSYRELAEQNNIQDPNLIQVGQQINLFGGVARPLAQPVQPTPSAAPPVKDQPKVLKVPYSAGAQAKVEGVKETKIESRPLAEAKPVVKSESKAEPRAESKSETDDAGDDTLEWSMPTQGKLIGGFSESDNRKGIDIVGKPGQAIFASAPGKVVYSGTGLRGYGKLLIVKHNKTYLSAYAHNDQLLVKEGDTVARGQKIAEMGNSDSENGQVKLHFEVRRFGKPVDPANYLALNKS